MTTWLLSATYRFRGENLEEEEEKDKNVETDLLPNTDELVALHGEGVEPDVRCLNPHICELKREKINNCEIRSCPHKSFSEKF